MRLMTAFASLFNLLSSRNLGIPKRKKKPVMLSFVFAHAVGLIPSRLLLAIVSISRSSSVHLNIRYKSRIVSKSFELMTGKGPP